LTDSKNNIQHRKNSSKFLSLNKRIVIVWFTIAQILLITTEMASYEDMKYFFWAESVLVPLLFVLYIRGVPDQLSREQEKEQKKAIFVLAFSFTCLIIAFFTAILNRY